VEQPSGEPGEGPDDRVPVHHQVDQAGGGAVTDTIVRASVWRKRKGCWRVRLFDAQGFMTQELEATSWVGAMAYLDYLRRGGTP
jgi:hypothetical protein